MRPLYHECGEPLCHEIVPVKEQYCERHEAKHEQQWRAHKTAYRKSKLAKVMQARRQKKYDQVERDPDAAEFYHSKSWRQVRDYVYARDNATCQVCGNILTDRKIIDHVIPRRLLTRMQSLDTKGLWTLCYKCHWRKTQLEQSIAQQPNGDTKLRHLDQRWWRKVLTESKGQTN